MIPWSAFIGALSTVPLVNKGKIMTTCTKCGRPDTEGSRFCAYCGAALVAAQAPATEISPPPTAINYPPPPVADRLIGQTIDGKYRIDERIGEGGMGTVYRATRLMIGDVVAVKVLTQEQPAPAQAAERFRREAQAATRLKHPNAGAIHDFGVTTSGTLYLVMELVEGDSLRDIITRQGPLAPAVAAEILNQVAAALDEAHRQNIVHCDLKPDNIIVLVTQQGLRVKALDFGIAKLRDLQTSDSLTQTGALVGTPQYMSPEQCLGEELDGRSDVYSLGIVLFEMLTGAIPFNAPSALATILQQAQQPPPSPRALNPKVSPAVEAVVLHALQKRREARPQTAGVLAKEMMFAISNSELGNVTAPSPPAAHGASMTNPPSPSDAAPPLAPAGQMGQMGAAPGRGAPADYPPFPASGVPSSDVPAPNRKPLIIGLSAGAIALIGMLIAVYFLFRSDNSPQKELESENSFVPQTQPSQALPPIASPLPPAPANGSNDYSGSIGSTSSTFSLSWNKNNTVTGVYYRNDSPNTVYTLSGTNFRPGEAEIKAYQGDQIIATMKIYKNISGGKVCWSGSFDTTSGETSPISFCRDR